MRAHLTPLAWMPLLLTLGACRAYDASLLTTQWPSTADDEETCTADARAVAVELCNGKDDDCDGVLDEDAVNCDRPNWPGRCVFGACVSDGCDRGFGDCNKDPEDGCERALGECTTCDEACLGRLPGREARPVAEFGANDAATAITVPAANSGPPARTDPDLDAGETATPVQSPALDAGSKPESPVDECDDLSTCSSPQQCGARLARCACRATRPTGQGAECDSCACEKCSDELNRCTSTGDERWNFTCAALTSCFGQGKVAGTCTRNDCADVCQSEYFASSQRVLGSLQCNFGSCSAFDALRRSCYAGKCAAVCKF